MKTYTTNYQNTLIEIAQDCPTHSGVIPLIKGDRPTVAHLQFNRLYEHPYQYTSDEVLFDVFAARQDLKEEEYEEAKQQFFSKGQACFRASPLTKQYGWGVHSNEHGKIALYGAETDAYRQLVANPSVKKVKAMRSRRP